jgi:nitrogen fixation protein NifX
MAKTVKIDVISEGNEKNVLKVAFATDDIKKVNQNFSRAKKFIVYDITKEGYTTSGIIETDTSNLPDGEKTEYKISALKGVNIMYCENIIGGDAAKVISSGITPVKVKYTDDIEELLNQFVYMLNNNPPPWIKKIMHFETEKDPRLDFWKYE